MSDLVSSLPPVADLVAWCAVIAAAAAGLRWAYRAARQAGRTLDALAGVVQRELSHNSGTSMKDDVTNTVHALQTTNARIDEVHVILHNLVEANQLIWPAIEAVAKATPPATPEPPRGRERDHVSRG